MTKRLALVLLLSFIATACATAATVSSKFCGTKCVVLDYPHVQISLTGRIEKGDLERLKKQYAISEYFVCENRIDPGRWAYITPEEYKRWKRNHKASEFKPTKRALRKAAAADKKCHHEAIPFRPGYLNGALLITSGGGNLNEAMAIGRWVRKNRLAVVVPVKCASACVWILAAGLSRNVWTEENAKILIHRPFLVIDNPRVRAGAVLKTLLRKSKEYFDEMGVPPELADLMFSTSPDEAATLDKKQISYYRLDQLSIGFQEEMDFARAKHIGISREEYTLRMQRFNRLNKAEPCSSLIKSGDDKATIIRKLVKCRDERWKAIVLQK